MHKRLAEEGGPLAAKAREHAARAEEFAAKERAQAELATVKAWDAVCPVVTCP